MKFNVPKFLAGLGIAFSGGVFIHYILGPGEVNMFAGAAWGFAVFLILKPIEND